jgi:WD40 repeat protein
MPDGLRVLSSAMDSTHKMWDLHRRIGLATFDGCDLSHSTVPAVSSPDGDVGLLACGSADGSMVFWSTATSSASPDASAPVKAKHGGNAIARIRAQHAYPITANCWLPGDLGLVSGDTSGAINCLIP